MTTHRQQPPEWAPSQGSSAAPAATDDPKPVIELAEVRKTYGMDGHAVHALRGVSLAVPTGDYVAIMGASGSGKSTLMNIVGCLDVPTSGRYLLDGIEVGDLSDRQLALVRNRKIGFVFQSFNLLSRTSAIDNVELPLIYAGVPTAERRRRARTALELVGLGDRMSHKPNELSGGQQQRVAVARALVAGPAIILADEPTGNLDSTSSADVMALFDRLNTAGRTIVLITHEHDIAEHAQRAIRLMDGQIVSDERNGARDFSHLAHPRAQTGSTS
jgi:putative ABC transport system ATP-binding protein